VRSRRPAHPAIVSVETFTETQMVRRTRAAGGLAARRKLERGPRQTSRPYALRGRVRCGFCARRMEGTPRIPVLKRGFMTEKAAAKALREKLTAVDRGTHVRSDRTKTGPYLTETWLPTLRLAPSTTASYAKNVRLHLVRTSARAVGEPDRPAAHRPVPAP
jgi:hypothetical protein